MPKRSKSSARWLAEHASDEFVKRAQREGWRSRAVFKFGGDPSERTAAPARHSLRRSRRGARGMEPVRRAHLGHGERGRGHGESYRSDRYFVHGGNTGSRFRTGRLSRRARFAAVAGKHSAASKVDLVLSDMAPNMAGIDAVDQPRSMHLAELALEFADRVLAPGGDVLVKLFQGAGFDELIREARRRYGRVVTKKPKASRTRSSEIYLLARQFRMV